MLPSFADKLGFTKFLCLDGLINEAQETTIVKLSAANEQIWTLKPAMLRCRDALQEPRLPLPNRLSVISLR